MCTGRIEARLIARAFHLLASSASPSPTPRTAKSELSVCTSAPLSCGPQGPGPTDLLRSLEQKDSRTAFPVPHYTIFPFLRNQNPTQSFNTIHRACSPSAITPILEYHQLLLPSYCGFSPYSLIATEMRGMQPQSIMASPWRFVTLTIT